MSFSEALQAEVASGARLQVVKGGSRRARPHEKLVCVDPELVEAAAAVSANAHAPYSGFHVGAAVRSAQGTIYAACNVENVSYPVGTCAEAGALAAARSAEGDGFILSAIVIVATNAQGQVQPCSPCGACRQRIVEFSETAEVMFRTSAADWVNEPAAALLPYRFSFLPKEA